MRTYTFYLVKTVSRSPRFRQDRRKIQFAAVAGNEQTNPHLQSLLASGWEVSMFWYNA